MSSRIKTDSNEMHNYRTGAISCEVVREVDRQRKLWGQQDHPTLPAEPAALHEHYGTIADSVKAYNDRAAEAGTQSWDTILLEEVYEALCETDLANQRAELVQIAAVAQSMIAGIDRRAESVTADERAAYLDWINDNDVVDGPWVAPAAALFCTPEGIENYSQFGMTALNEPIVAP